MKHRVFYNYWEQVDGQPVYDETDIPPVEAENLSMLPVVGDGIKFRNSEDGPRGIFSVVGRTMEVGVVGDEMHLEVNIMIERSKG